MDLHFQFEHNDKVLSPVPPMQNYTGPVPVQDNILLFDGHEADALNSVNFPNCVWRVRQVAFDFADGSCPRVTVTLELRNKKAERESSR